MKDIETASEKLISDSYRLYSHTVCCYIYHRIHDWETARDLSQDVFLRLLTYKSMLREDTVKSFVFAIASNLVTDNLRRFYLKQEWTSYIYDSTEKSIEDTDCRVKVRELLELERNRMERLSDQQKKIYVMSRFQNLSVPEIASDLLLSVRTVENHLYASRKAVREFVRACI